MIPLISNIYTYKEKLILSLKGISPYFSSHLKNYQKIKKNDMIDQYEKCYSTNVQIQISTCICRSIINLTMNSMKFVIFVFIVQVDIEFACLWNNISHIDLSYIFLKKTIYDNLNEMHK